jgi:hypothetical protein
MAAPAQQAHASSSSHWCCCCGGGAGAADRDGVELEEADTGPVQDKCWLLTDTERLEKNHSRLSNAQRARNAAQSTAVFVFYAGLTVATAGSSLLVQAAASVIPVPVSWALPNALKNAYYLGYMHQRGKTDLGDAEAQKHKSLKERVLPEDRASGEATVYDGVFVFSLLSYPDANRARITVFGGSAVRAAYEATGVLLCSLDIKQGVLQLVLTSGKAGSGAETSQYVAMHHMDQVQYVSCGERPFQSKWHVVVKNGRPTEVFVKRPKSKTGMAGVTQPEKAAIKAVAERCRVWADGSSGCAKPEGEISAKTLWKEATLNMDPERLNLFHNRLKKRLESPEWTRPPAPLSAAPAHEIAA